MISSARVFVSLVNSSILSPCVNLMIALDFAAGKKLSTSLITDKITSHPTHREFPGEFGILRRFCPFLLYFLQKITSTKTPSRPAPQTLTSNELLILDRKPKGCFIRIGSFPVPDLALAFFLFFFLLFSILFLLPFSRSSIVQCSMASTREHAQ